MKYRKLPIVIEAITFDELLEYGRKVAPEDAARHDGIAWSFEYKGVLLSNENENCYLIPTLEGTMDFTRNDMLITGVNGEIYPCKIEIFNKTYEPVAE